MTIKNVTKYRYIFLFLTLLPLALHGQIEKEEVEVIQNILKKMQFIEEVETTIGQMWPFVPTKNDSTMLSFYDVKETKIESFYISATEVTNLEWWFFYKAMVEKHGEISAREKYYPDTLVWVKEIGYSYHEPYTSNYFHSEKYNDYPIVGINWNQAQEYCQWLTIRINEFLESEGIDLKLKFRLPSNPEWEYAATCIADKSDNRHLYGWPHHLKWHEDNYLANYGNVIDVNGIQLKDLASDGHFYTAPVGSYAPNKFGLYDMSGNVSEWLTDGLTQIDIESQLESFRLKNLSDTSYYIQKYIERGKRDIELVSKGDIKIVKGGSWNNSIIYMMAGNREGYDKNTKSSRIGFRTVVSIIEGSDNFLGKKKWKP